ncbi:hypothetical protein MN032_11890 [Agromyces atrinae]|uniref:hypothetical protein n=1 Tax=Agromyces atrinae TaxID=592376 RepID=UPI001F563796|nr:hypothetical protein [Agromyces atrinae]MCI2958395.1 hypothetical protein [Agromyces atrinae]
MIEADNAVMALLVGARLASSSLSLAEGSTLLISEMYPTVPHIKRFQVRPDRARKLLDGSESHLARISIPYAMSVHEDYVNGVRDDLVSSGISLITGTQHWNAENMHRIIFATMVAALPAELDTFDLLRRIRNCLIHQGGVVDQYLRDGIAALSPGSASRWNQVVGRPATDLALTEQVSLGLGEIMIAFSVTRHLSKKVHEASLAALPRTLWLEECVSDFRQHHEADIRARRLLRRKLQAWSTSHYDGFNFSWSDLHDEAVAQGLSSTVLRMRNPGRRVRDSTSDSP